MDIQSVSSSLGSLIQQTTQTQQNQQAQFAQPVDNQEPRPEERVEKTEEPAPQPVVNAQGQTTGTLINVTA